ncbi:unnamed protein product, partial [Prorocentrum cordatum]
VSLEAAPAAAGLSQPAGLGGRLVIRNTFFHFQDYEEERRALRLFRSSSAPELRPPPPAGRGPEAPRGRPPPPSGAEWRTSLLFRNVPYALTRDMLVEALGTQGYRGQFDLVYLPRDFKTNQALGYAFVNALTPEIAARMGRSFDGFQAWPVKSQKKCSVGWSRRQGLQSNLAVYRNLTVMKGSSPEAWKPALFLRGNQVSARSEWVRKGFARRPTAVPAYAEQDSLPTSSVLKQADARPAVAAAGFG